MLRVFLLKWIYFVSLEPIILAAAMAKSWGAAHPPPEVISEAKPSSQVHVTVSAPEDSIAAVRDRHRLADAPPATAAPRQWQWCNRWRLVAMVGTLAAAIAVGITLGILGSMGKLSGGSKAGAYFVSSPRNRSYIIQPAFQAELHTWLMQVEVAGLLGAATDADVIVIGAGVAGLAAAAALQAQQLRVVVLEARVRAACPLVFLPQARCCVAAAPYLPCNSCRTRCLHCRIALVAASTACLMPAAGRSWVPATSGAARAALTCLQVQATPSLVPLTQQTLGGQWWTPPHARCMRRRGSL